MAWETPKTWGVGDRGNAVNLNRYIRDQQIALREEAAGLAQRLALLEVSGFGAPLLRELALTTSSLVVYSDLTPPADTQLIYVAVRAPADTGSAASWSAVPLIDYALWAGLAVTQSGTPANDARWPFVAPSTDFGSGRVLGYVGRGPDNVLIFGVVRPAAGDLVYDAVCVRWYR